jgi:hypothetical protein
LIVGLTDRSMSLPGLTGQSSTLGLCLLDRPVKPGDDSESDDTENDDTGGHRQ